MALPVVVKEPEQPKGPSPEELLVQERQERLRQEQQWREDRAAMDARLAQMERGMYAQRQPMTPERAEAELGLTAEDIARDPERGLELLKQHIARDLEKRYEPVVSGLAEQAFSSQIEALKTRKYYPDVAPLMEQYFEANPGERRRPGAAQDIYERLVGKNAELLAQKYAQQSGESIQKNYTADHRVVEAPIRPTGTINVDRTGDEDRVEMTDTEREAYKYWHGMGVIASEREWAEIAKGNVFPKNVAADWQPEAARSLVIKRGRVSRVE